MFLFFLFRYPVEERPKFQYNEAMKKHAQLARKGVNQLLKDVHEKSMRFETVQDFATFLEENPAALEYKEPQNESKIIALQFKIVESIKGNVTYYHVLLYDEELFFKFNVHTNFVDSTFKTCPKIGGVTQFMTVMGKKNEDTV